MKRTVKAESVVRALAHASYAYPVALVDGDAAPHAIGEQGYWTTPSGKTRITYPNAYRWPKTYHCSTLRVVVGRDYLARLSWERDPATGRWDAFLSRDHIRSLRLR